MENKPIESEYLRKIHIKTADISRNYKEVLGNKEDIFSENIKTGYSINFPIALTCRPTKICSKSCYAIIGGRPITWKNSLKKQLRIFRYFKNSSTQSIAERIISEYHRKKLTWLRWCGCGDLFPEAVAVINKITILDPTIKQLVVTRKPEMANKITSKCNNLYLMFSLDSDSTNKIKKLKNNPRMFFSYLRTCENDDTSMANIIFNEQKQKHTLPYDDKYRCCPVDSGKIELADECNKCKKCFSETVFTRR